LRLMAELEVEIATLMRQIRAGTGRAPTIGAVESATGGRIAARITSVAGSSDYFRGSVVAYSNDVKIRVVGVRKATIEHHGAVSEQTALEMARGGRRLFDVDICVSDTGIAGPTGGTHDKPVGLFYLGLATGDAVVSQKHVFTGDREGNRRQAAEAALGMLRQCLLTHLEKSKGAVGNIANGG
jgi:PncC family amidohydrolase